MIKPVRLWTDDDVAEYGLVVAELMQKPEGALLIRLLEDMSDRLGRQALRDLSIGIEWYRGGAAVIDMLLQSFRALASSGEQALNEGTLFVLPNTTPPLGPGGA